MRPCPPCARPAVHARTSPARPPGERRPQDAGCAPRALAPPHPTRVAGAPAAGRPRRPGLAAPGAAPWGVGAQSTPMSCAASRTGSPTARVPDSIPKIDVGRPNANIGVPETGPKPSELWRERHKSSPHLHACRSGATTPRPSCRSSQSARAVSLINRMPVLAPCRTMLDGPCATQHMRCVTASQSTMSGPWWLGNRTTLFCHKSVHNN